MKEEPKKVPEYSLEEEVAVAAAYEKALSNGWTERKIGVETSGRNAWKAYKAIMAGWPYTEYRDAIRTGKDIPLTVHKETP